MSTLGDVSGRVAFITGAGSGIGRACAHRLVELGATVVATDIDPAALEGLPAIESLSNDTLDVTDADAVATSIDTWADRLGRLDIVVCSAGIVFADEADRVADSRADWDRCMAVNLHGTINVCEAATPRLRESDDGAIVTIGSISAHAARATSGAYPTSKAAALRYAKSLALTLAPSVRVNAVCPGAVWTGMQEQIADVVQQFAGTAEPENETTFFARYEATTPMLRPQTPRDVANAVAFLASPDAANITGQCLHVDGGAVIRD